MTGICGSGNHGRDMMDVNHCCSEETGKLNPHSRTAIIDFPQEIHPDGGKTYNNLLNHYDFSAEFGIKWLLC